MPLRRSLRVAVTAMSSSLALALWAPSALATFHLVDVREVYPGSAASPNAEYVELQMYASEQQYVGGHTVRIYGAAGALVGQSAFAADSARGANQSTVLMATPQAEAQFGVIADGALSPSGLLDPAGGAVCWEALDCVSWGGFGGSLPSPAGSPAAPGGIPDGMALRRTISPGCATLLEPADDRDSSALDFQVVFPSPRPNAASPAEHACGSQGGGPAGEPSSGAGAEALQTRITGHPRRVTSDRTPTFRFATGAGGAMFLCRLDRRRFRRCHSPFTAPRLGAGRHLFEVKALAPDGRADPSPAAYRFRIRAGQ